MPEQDTIPKYEDSQPIDVVPRYEDSSPVEEQVEPGKLRKVWNFLTSPLPGLDRFSLPHVKPGETSGSVIIPGMAPIIRAKRSRILGDWESEEEAAKREESALNPVVSESIAAGQNLSADIYNSVLSPLGLGATTIAPIAGGSKLVGAGLAGLSVPAIAGGVKSLSQIPESKQKVYDTLYGSGSIVLGGLGLKGAKDLMRSKAAKGSAEGTPSDIVEEAMSNPSKEEYPYDVSQYSDINEPLNIPWKAANDKGKYLVPDSRVKAEIDNVLGETTIDKGLFKDLTPEEKFNLKAAPAEVQRQFLHDRQTEGIQSDTPEVSRFEDLGIDLPMSYRMAPKLLRAPAREMPEQQPGFPVIGPEKQLIGSSIKLPEGEIPGQQGPSIYYGPEKQLIGASIKLPEKLPPKGVSQEEYDLGRTYEPEPESQPEIIPPMSKETLKPLVEKSKLFTEPKPYKAPSVSTDLRQLEKQMQKNTVSTKEPKGISEEGTTLYSNPIMDPKFIEEWIKKNKVLIPGMDAGGGVSGGGKTRPLFELKGTVNSLDYARYHKFLTSVKGMSDEAARKFIDTRNYNSFKELEADFPGDVKLAPRRSSDILYANPIEPLLDTAKKAFKFFMPSIDKVQQRYGSNGQLLAPKMTKFYKDMSDKKGTAYDLPEYYINKELPAVSQLTGNSKMLDNVRDYLLDMNDYGQSQIQLNPGEQRILKIFQESMKYIGEERNLRPGLHQGTLNPYYIPPKLSPEMATELARPSKMQPQREQEFIDDQINVKHRTPAQAKENWETLKKAFLQSDMSETNKGVQYGPLDKAEGFGIPRSWMEPGLMNILQGYVNRAARRIAYHDNFETDPSVSYALEKLRNEPEVAPVIRNIEGKMSHLAHGFDALSGAVKAGEMQTASGLRDFISTTTGGLRYMLPEQYIPGYLEGMKSIGEGLRAGLEKGVIQRNKGFFENNQSSLIETDNLLRQIQNGMNRVSLRSLSDQMSRAHQMSVARYSLMSNFSKELTGSGNAQTKFVLKRMIPDIDQYLRLGVLPNEALNQGAAEWVSSVAGKYDPRTIPAEMMTPDNPVGIVMNMNKWNIDQANTFHKDVLGQMTKGNYYPMLGTLLGGFVGGEAIFQLNHLLNGLKNQVPSLTELVKTPQSDAEDLLYHLSALVDAQGVAGQYGSLIKNFMDIEHGNRVTNPVGNPLYEIITKNVTRLAQGIKAISDEGTEASPKIVLNMMDDFMRSLMQDYRILGNHLWGSEDVAQQNRVRDLRTFQELSKTEKPESRTFSTFTENPYTNLGQKEMNRTSDIPEFLNKLSGEYSKALKSGDVNMVNSLVNSGGIDYMPSPVTKPMEFSKFQKFILDTQGEEALRELNKRYLNQTTNQMLKKTLPTVKVTR